MVWLRIFLGVLICFCHNKGGTAVDQDDIVPPKYRDDVRKMIYHIPFDGTPEVFEVDEDQVSYHLFTRTNVDNYINIDVSNPTQLNTTKKLIFIIHGWTENRSRRWYEELKNALLEKDDVFVVQVDYSEPASHGYLTAVTLAPKVGVIIAGLLLKINTDYNIPLSNIELIAHSLGAQVSGYVGQELARYTEEKLKKIVGLDPAGPLFSNTGLASNDAQVVESIHTNLVLGIFSSIGTADFYPNAGSFLQPGCLDQSDGDLYNAVFCSHHRSYWFYIEALRTGGFTGRQCSSWSIYALGLCFYKPTLQISHASIYDEGNYYLRTNEQSPYSQS